MPCSTCPGAVALVLGLSISIAPAASPRNYLFAPIQSAPSSGANAKPVLLSSGTAIVAKLLTSVDSRNSKPGDAVEAEITGDVSQNHKVVLKKGTRVLGHIVAVSADSASGTESRLAISFNSVTMRGGDQAQISFVIQALAREPVLQNQVDLLDGRGSEATQITATASGGSIGGPLPGGLLRPEDSGVYGIPGVNLALMTTKDGSQVPILVSTGGSIRLAKDTQMILRVVQN
ncbi:MAG: hypothetical protein WBX16_05370 [Candidatus Acidiferrales bacterium]